VRDGDHLGAEAEREQHLGGRRDETDDPHQPSVPGRRPWQAGGQNIKGDAMAEMLNEDEIDTRLRRLPWEREGDEIVREWRFENFAEAIAFVNQVADLAEEANHHPDILIHGWNKVKLSLTNHSAGGLTEVDFTIAARFDTLA
jgi:4a-hydroxytetrahydrobiopterin dehydratase